jgi:hypothetical protein
MRRPHPTIVVIATSAFLAQMAVGTSADETGCAPWDVAVDDRIRVASPDLGTWPVSGRLAAVDDDALLMARPDRTGLVRIPWCSISRLEVSRRTQPRTRKGAIVGGLVLGIPLALVAMLYTVAGEIDCEHSCRGLPGIAGAGVVGVGVGTGIGAAIGSVARTDRWEAAPRKKVSVIVRPQREGMAAGLVVSF